MHLWAVWGTAGGRAGCVTKIPIHMNSSPILPHDPSASVNNYFPFLIISLPDRYAEKLMKSNGD